jgi:hypothetical protein
MANIKLPIRSYIFAIFYCGWDKWRKLVVQIILFLGLVLWFLFLCEVCR